MPEILVNQKVFGVKVKTHVWIFAGVYLVSMCFLLLAFIDYSNLPPKVDPEVKGYLWDYLSGFIIFVSVLIVVLILVLVFRNPNNNGVQSRTFYGVVAVIWAILGLYYGCCLLIGLFPNFNGLSSFFTKDQKKWDLKNKYYPYAQFGSKLDQLFMTIDFLYLSTVLGKVAFFTTPPPFPIDQPDSSLPTAVVIEESSKNLEKSGKSGKSGKSETSQESEPEG